MGNFKSLQTYRRVMRKKIKAIERGADQGSLKTAKLMVANAKSMAARHTGETIRGIRKRRLNLGNYVAESYVSPKGIKGFRQNMWQNRTSPHNRPKMFWNGGYRFYVGSGFGKTLIVEPGKPTVYGDGSHNTTGVPEFWNISASKIRKVFGRIIRANTEKALRINA